MKKIWLSCMLALLCFAGGSVFAETGPGGDAAGGTESDREHVFSIQNRLFHKDHEISLHAGYIANDDFFHPYPLGISYTYHFNEYLAWEVARGQYLFNQDKDLKSDLETRHGLTPSEFDEPTYMLHSHLVVKPFYGKDSVFNSSILNHESYFLIGGGVVNYERKYSWGASDTETAASISFGYGIKYFMSKSLAVNFEVRDLVNLKSEKTINNIYLGLGLTYRFNMSPRRTERDETADKLREYLEDGE